MRSGPSSARALRWRGDYTSSLTPSPHADATRATGGGLFVASLVLAGIYFGSRRLRDFDAALVPYAGASVFSAFGLGYRYSMWLTKPPTRLLLDISAALVIVGVSLAMWRRGRDRGALAVQQFGADLLPLV
jgi:hypothetical protein